MNGKLHQRGRDEEEKLLDRFRDPGDPLKYLIVTSKLLTGFDAPILQAMYLDKPMRDHNLLQAICRTNRIYPNKTHGLIVDYIGIFDDVAQALDFDEKAVQQVITNLDEVKKELPKQVAKCLTFFPNVDRTVGGYEGLIAAQDCLPNNEKRDAFAAEYSLLGRIWEALSPDPCLSLYETDYRWLTQVYESVKPPSGNGKLLWHVLGAKTIDLIHQNTQLDTVQDDIETLVMDAEVLESVLGAPDPDKKGKKLTIQLIARLRKHAGNPKFVDLGERLEKIKEKHEQGLIDSKQFLKQLLELAKDMVEAEQASRSRGGARQSQSGAHGTVHGSQNRGHAGDRRADRQRHRRDRPHGPLPRLAKHLSRRTRSPESPPQNAAEIQTAQRPRTVRPSVRLHPAVLLMHEPKLKDPTSSASNLHHKSARDS